MQIYGTCRCKTVLSQSFTWIRGFVIFARISSLKVISFNWDLCCIIIVIVIDKNYIYMLSFILSSWGKALIQFFHSVSIKLLDFFLSFNSLFFEFTSSLKQNSWPELSLFHASRLQLFIWISFEPELNQIHAFTTERFILNFFVITDLLLIF